ncbi:MAG: Lrp/AsnC family transcriptional regulator [Candidatus Bathyarchaeia archaeon]
MLLKKDLILLKELIEDSRQKITELAEKSSLTRQSVYEKIKEFYMKGFRFTVDIKPKDVGLNLMAYILIVADPNVSFRKETDAIIKEFKEVSQIHYILGRFDVIVEVMVKDMEEFRKDLTRIQSLPAVRKTETLMVYETTKQNRLDPIIKAIEEKIKGLE